MRLFDDPHPFGAGNFTGADHLPHGFDQDLRGGSLERAEAGAFEGCKNFRRGAPAPSRRMRYLVRAERVEVDCRGDLVHRGEQPGVAVKVKRRIDAGEKTDLGDMTFLCQPCPGPDRVQVQAVGPGIGRFLPEAAETTEVLADVRDVQVLVPDVGDDITDFLLPHLVSSRSDAEHVAAGRLHEEFTFVWCEPVAGLYVTQECGEYGMCGCHCRHDISIGLFFLSGTLLRFFGFPGLFT